VQNNMHRDAEEWRHGEGIAPSDLSKREQGGVEVLFHYSIIGNCMVIKIDLNQIYRSYSGTQKIQNEFL